MKTVLVLCAGLALLSSASLFKSSPSFTDSTNGLACKANSEDSLPKFNTSNNFRIDRLKGLSVSKQSLQNAQTLKDIVPHYPEKWINEYISVKIAHKNQEAIGQNHELTIEQKELLQSLNNDEGAHIELHYLQENSVTGILEEHTMNLNVLVLPAKQAQFPYGQDSIIQHITDRLETGLGSQTFQADSLSIYFTVNEKGSVNNVQIKQSSGYPISDGLLMKILKDLPQWTPAQTEDGTLTQQTFELSYGWYGC